MHLADSYLQHQQPTTNEIIYFYLVCRAAYKN